MGEAARRHIAEKFTWEEVGKRLLAEVDALINLTGADSRIS
jgi:hypothetical protein